MHTTPPTSESDACRGFSHQSRPGVPRRVWSDRPLLPTTTPPALCPRTSSSHGPTFPDLERNRGDCSSLKSPILMEIWPCLPEQHLRMQYGDKASVCTRSHAASANRSRVPHACAISRHTHVTSLGSQEVGRQNASASTANGAWSTPCTPPEHPISQTARRGIMRSSAALEKEWSVPMSTRCARS